MPAVDDLSTTLPKENLTCRIVGCPVEALELANASLRRSNSPEIPLQEGLATSDSVGFSSSGNSFVGLRVVAKWSSNGYFYSGTITQDVGGAKYKLLFDDGYECDVLGRDILLCDPLPLETEVTALSEDEYFSAGNRGLAEEEGVRAAGGGRGGWSEKQEGPQSVVVLLPLLQEWSRDTARKPDSSSTVWRKTGRGSGINGPLSFCLWNKGTGSGSSLGLAPMSPAHL